MSDTPTFTAAEVAFVLCEPVKAIKKAFDDGPIAPKLVQKANGTVRAVGWLDIVYLLAVRALRDELTPKARADFYDALRLSPVDRVSEVRFGRLSIAINDFKSEAKQRTRDLARLVSAIDFGMGGEAVLKGTNVEAHRIAALSAGGMTPDEILNDYPSLTRDQITTAEGYTAAYPKSGRPYPSKTAKRALRGAGLEALDEVLDAET